MGVKKIGSSPSKGFFSYDAMFSLIPMMFLILFILDVERVILTDSLEKQTTQERFDTLVVIADYVVKRGAFSDGKAIYPNLIEPSKIKGIEDELRRKLEMSELFIGIESDENPPTDRTCIYRIILNKRSGEIDRLFVCG